MRCAAPLTLAILLAAIPANAGPPFQTDDPDPVDFHHFEMYAFTLSDGTTAGGTTLSAPAYEVNYGVVPNVQLHLVLPFNNTFVPDGPNQHGIGDTELGAKIRFVKETKRVPEIGIFPFFELPSGNADNGLGVGKTWYRMPLWLQKSWGPDDAKWTSYGGGGYTIVPQDGFVNFPFAGWLVQRQISKKLTLGTELFGHGPQTPDTTRSSTMLDLGGIYEFHEGFDLLFAAGKSVYGQPETYSYLALYWTWGPKDPADAGKDQTAAGTGSKMLNTLSHIRL
jgi:Putative MetA-pathway of phenol degradation